MVAPTVGLNKRSRIDIPVISGDKRKTHAQCPRNGILQSLRLHPRRGRSSKVAERGARDPVDLSFSLAFLGVFVPVVIFIVFIVGSFISDNIEEYNSQDDPPDKEIPKEIDHL